MKKLLILSVLCNIGYAKDRGRHSYIARNSLVLFCFPKFLRVSYFYMRADTHGAIADCEIDLVSCFSLQCSWTRHETLNPIKICTEVLPVFLNAMRKMATIKAFRLVFLLLMAFPFYLLPIFENKSELLKLVRITWKGDCKIFEMAVVRGKDNTLSETNHNYHQVWDRIFSFMTWSIDVNCLFVFFGTKRFLGVF